MPDKEEPKKESTSDKDEERLWALTRQNMELEQQVKELTAQIIEIKSGTAWKIVQLLWKIRLKAFPPASLREKFAREIPGFNKPSPGASSISSQKGQELIKPVVSIVIPVYNALAYTQECLESLSSVKTRVPVEIIVINNGSTDNTKSWLESYGRNKPNMRTVSLEANLGFGPGVNVGIRRSLGDYIVILNNDTIATPNWLDNMLSVFEQDNTIGIVSPVTNYTATGAQLDVKARDLRPEDARKYADSIQGRTGFVYEPNRLAFFCAMLSRQLVDKIGLLDERYELGNFEDYDYCFRAIMAGYRLAIARNSFIYHHGSETFKVNQISYAGHFEQNQTKFFTRVDELASTTLRMPAGPEKRVIETSVIVYTKDHPITLQRALIGLANQTYQDFEVVIVNHGGQDLSNIIDPYRQYLNITCLRGDMEQGRAHALNAAIKQVNGKWIGYLDDGDFLYPWHLECLMIGLRGNPGYKFAYSNHNKALMASDIESVPSKIQGGAVWEFDRDDLVVANHPPILCCLHEKDCVVQAGYFDETIDLLEDYELWLRCSKDQDFLHINRVTCEQRIYVSGKNLITDRKKALDGLRAVYSRHPAESLEVEEKRRIFVRDMENQAKEIQEIYGEVKDETEAQRKIITLLTGL